MSGMKLSRVDLNLFVVLETIYAEGGITRAAEKLRLSQPAISHSLARLRELFGDPLFQRIGQRMMPTPLTQQLIDPLRSSLDQIGSVIRETGRFDPATAQRKLVIGIRTAFESSVMPRVMQALQAQAPGIRVSTIRLKRAEIERELGSGSLDLAIDVPLSFTDAVRTRRLSADRLVVVVRKEHPVIQGRVDLPTYLSQRHILVTGRRLGQALEDVELRKLGYTRDVAWRCQSYLAGCAAVAQTDLVLTMVSQQAVMASASFGNQVLEMPAIRAQMELYLYWHQNAEHDMANRWVRQRVADCFPA